MKRCIRNGKHKQICIPVLTVSVVVVDATRQSDGESPQFTQIVTPDETPTMNHTNESEEMREKASTTKKYKTYMIAVVVAMDEPRHEPLVATSNQSNRYNIRMINLCRERT
jgi:hypothetical protein